MVTRSFVLAAALVACGRPTSREIRGLLDEPGTYACTCYDGGVGDAPVPDAAPPVDAAPDASTPVPPDLNVAWTRTVITPGSTTGIYRGADGVSQDARGCWVTAWEEGGAVTRACLVAGAWVTEVVATGLAGAEDAKAADLDGDGVIDVVTAADSGQRVYVTFRNPAPAVNSTTTLTASMGHGHAMQVAIADLDGDADLDIAFGTRIGTPAVVAWLENPGGASTRVGSAWTYHPISLAGWTMSLEVRGPRIYVSDRGAYKDDAGVTQWGLNGARYLELEAGAWTNHGIGPAGGSCPVSNYQCTTATPGDELFLRVVSPTEVWDCQSNFNKPTSRIRRQAWDGSTWAITVLPPATNVAHCQDVLVTDVDGDGLADVVVSGTKGDHAPTDPLLADDSGVYWLRAPLWERGEISGPAGVKFDNVELLGNGCVITSEQIDQLGVVLYCPPPGVP